MFDNVFDQVAGNRQDENHHPAVRPEGSRTFRTQNKTQENCLYQSNDGHGDTYIFRPTGHSGVLLIFAAVCCYPGLAQAYRTNRLYRFNRHNRTQKASDYAQTDASHTALRHIPEQTPTRRGRLMRDPVM
ncbi:hypothetical protein [Thalassospira povalilytica]|uniref:hypothetical protein n=1 Tax=Thalassospira povalilytica TaxID=732237 RepID=UPI001D18C9EC|nr:hypothetical protein [Thalassospira povalilytica]